jgi:hypothetical protein
MGERRARLRVAQQRSAQNPAMLFLHRHAVGRGAQPQFANDIFFNVADNQLRHAKRCYQ